MIIPTAAGRIDCARHSAHGGLAVSVAGPASRRVNGDDQHSSIRLDEQGEVVCAFAVDEDPKAWLRRWRPGCCCRRRPAGSSRATSFITPPAAAPQAAASPFGLTPSQVRTAYGVGAIRFGSVVGDGSGQTIAIIDAFHAPTIAQDLAAFDAAFGLPRAAELPAGGTGRVHQLPVS